MDEVIDPIIDVGSLHVSKKFILQIWTIVKAIVDFSALVFELMMCNHCPPAEQSDTLPCL